MLETRSGLGEVTHVWSPQDAEKRGLANWSLKPLQTSDDVHREYALALGVHVALLNSGARVAYAPHVAAMSGAIVDTALLDKNIDLWGFSLKRNKRVPADGVFLEVGEAYAMSAAGCPVVVARAANKMVVAHVGRDSLLDRRLIAIGMPSRKHPSIVHAIVDALEKFVAHTADIQMRMQFCIPPRATKYLLKDPLYGNDNCKMSKYVDRNWPGCTIQEARSMYLDLELLFCAQAQKLGVYDVRTMNSLESFPDLAHTQDGHDPFRRNLVIVKRES